MSGSFPPSRWCHVGSLLAVQLDFAVSLAGQGHRVLVLCPALGFRSVRKRHEGGGRWRWADNLPGCLGKEQLRGKMGAAVGMKLVIL